MRRFILEKMSSLTLSKFRDFFSEGLSWHILQLPLLVLGVFLFSVVPVYPEAGDRPVVVMEIVRYKGDKVVDSGEVAIELYRDKAPVTVANFLRYAGSGLYEGTMFHRLMEGFMLQGGGFKPGFEPIPTYGTIKNEARNGLSNLRGMVAMARTDAIDSATSQFFINLNDNVSLDHRKNTPAEYGYAVFGKIIKGMELLDRLQKVETKAVNDYFYVPQDMIVIKSVKVTGS